jgi:hypothetical protein
VKRFRDGYKWNSVTIGMTSRTTEEGLEIVPFDHETGQLMFRWMVEYE